VSVVGLLDRNCGNNIHENPMYGICVQRKKKKKDKEGSEVCI
jgi:hypothetical protein